MPKRFVEITFDLKPVMPSSLDSLLISTSIEQEDDLSSDWFATNLAADFDCVFRRQRESACSRRGAAIES